MFPRTKGTVNVGLVGVALAAFGVLGPAAAQTSRYKPTQGGYRPLTRQQPATSPLNQFYSLGPAAQPLVQWGNPYQQFSSPFSGLPQPLQSPATFFQVPGASYAPLRGTYRPLSSGYQPLRR